MGKENISVIECGKCYCFSFLAQGVRRDCTAGSSKIFLARFPQSGIFISFWYYVDLYHIEGMFLKCILMNMGSNNTTGNVSVSLFF
ncbi:hypothetical protein J437_LFUL002169 [Ladona fulva]|uniref:Uncharacterized protein n=1 Tax=Ladona fulva TaxID=123851 RepID=A0A8K0JZD0_LADFU|nr:hypothetical protein J437_LFUL002169 [Ladona fulva]